MVRDFSSNPAYKDILFNYSGRNEKVTQEYKYFGFGEYRVTGPNKVELGNYLNLWTGEIYGMDNYVDSQILEDVYVDGGLLVDSANLSRRYADGQYVVSDYDIARSIQRYNSEFLTGPNYKTGGLQTIDTFNHYLGTQDMSWYNPHLVMESNQFVSIDWTDLYFEQSPDYKYYQLLIIDGVVMDGRLLEAAVLDKDGNVLVSEIRLPYIFRYTGGTASPKVEWKFSFVEAAYPYAVYEEKFVNGVGTGELAHNGEFGKLVGEAIYNYLTGKYEYRVWYNGVEYLMVVDNIDIPFPGNVGPMPPSTSAEMLDNLLDLLNDSVRP